ncbi:DUF3090 domain-containing protein [Herbiconiux moechotypicola]|uniref:DUF3090 domain-containing protein n=1 Tax=Herbiconiux moechotypicola TaxID=637393 RepID=A0ABN3DN12_9MICO|nr:DUF3090 domain-containing protein [Herbiconiux moechotypicola]MCS5730139.1 DUF3090 domain-containing protein [Herbiconiux moechotypicola]
MPTIVHEFDWPDRVVIGTIGRPGERTFYLQARTGSRIVSASLEKEQSALLAEKIDEILDQLMAGEGNPFSVPAVTPVELVDNEPLDQPVQEEFRTGTMSLGWDPSTAQIVLEAFPLVVPDDDEDDDDGPGIPAGVYSLDEAEQALEAALADAAGIDELIERETIEPEEVLLVRMPVGTARAFAKRTREIVGAGRDLCPLCGLPIDPDGHDCVFPGGL